VLRRSGKPVVVAANKVDDTKAESEVAALWSLGLGEPVPVSALHGRGSGDLLDLVLEALPDAPKDAEETERGPRRVALIGRPNVGKSSLLNKLAGQERVLVDSVAGTTRAGRHHLAFRGYGGHQAPVPREPGRGLLRRGAHRGRA
jgi:GTP-binding protein